MNRKENEQIRVHDFEPGQDCFLEEVLSGLRKSQKELPCKYFYDEQGSRLFERICSLDEYYIPRAETAIMQAYIEQMAEMIGPGALLIEYGSGSSAKTRILLDHCKELVAYIPIDISREQLLRVATELASDYPWLNVLPVCADYTSDFALPPVNQPYRRRIVYFPGSTIGNFNHIQANDFLRHIAELCGPGGALLVGVDLKEDPAVLHRAYNDPHGVTAAFNLNLLQRINRELNADFQLDCFRHHAFYNPSEGRIEMHLISLKDHSVSLDNATISFAKGESIWTESSYKFTTEEFAQLAFTAGFQVERLWTDEKHWFSVQFLVNRG